MKSKVWIEATVSVELNRRQVEVLAHLCSYGSGLVKAIREKVTSGVSERDALELVDHLNRELAPVIRAISAAEAKLNEKPAADQRPADTIRAVPASS